MQGAFGYIQGAACVTESQPSTTTLVYIHMYVLESLREGYMCNELLSTNATLQNCTEGTAVSYIAKKTFTSGYLNEFHLKNKSVHQYVLYILHDETPNKRYP